MKPCTGKHVPSSVQGLTRTKDIAINYLFDCEGNGHELPGTSISSWLKTKVVADGRSEKNDELRIRLPRADMRPPTPTPGGDALSTHNHPCHVVQRGCLVRPSLFRCLAISR